MNRQFIYLTNSVITMKYVDVETFVDDIGAVIV